MSKSTIIIAEAGVNHNGDVRLAEKLIEVAANSGVDYVKFQTYKTELLATNNAQKATYQQEFNKGADDNTQFTMLKNLELSPNDYPKLLKCCAKHQVQFLSTPFDLESLDFLVNVIKLEVIKIGSGDLTNLPLLYQAARTGVKIIISTGMATLMDIEIALGALAAGYLNGTEPPSLALFSEAYLSEKGQELLESEVSVLHCTTEYPAPFDEVNLRAMDTLKCAFNLTVGFSDHTPGIAIPVAAVALGAQIIEKHFTLDKSMSGPDHKASLEPDELNEMVKSIREVELALGSTKKLVTRSELANKKVARRILVANKIIKKGDILSEDNVSVKRSGKPGIQAQYYYEYIGGIANNNYQLDEPIKQ